MWARIKEQNFPVREIPDPDAVLGSPPGASRPKKMKYGIHDALDRATRPQLIENQNANSQKKGPLSGRLEKEAPPEAEGLFRVKVCLGENSSLNQPHLLQNRERASKVLKSFREKTIGKLKKYRPRMNQKKRKVILQLHPWFFRIFNCSSKASLILVLSQLPGPYKDFVKLYLRRFFLMHVHLRQIKNLFQLMSHRQSIYNAVDQPEILRGNMKFKNNMVKNFCKGVVNFVVLFYEELQDMHFLSPAPRLTLS